MKRILLFLSVFFIATTAIAHTINWYVDGNIFHTTTCESGDNVTPPTAPEKYGYTFQGWKEYIQIEYLESTGTQYIDTGFAYDQTMGSKPFQMDATFALVKYITNSQNTFYFFSGVSTNVLCTAQFTYNSFDNYFMWDRSTIGRGIFSTTITGEDILKPFRMISEINPYTNIYTVYDGFSDSWIEQELFSNETSDKNVWLFRSNDDHRVGPIRIYHWSFESDGTKIRDFIPVLDKDGTPCMFDKVEKKFYYNAGTGDFIAGPIIGE